MPPLTTDQTLQISGSLLRAARAIDHYRFTHLNEPGERELMAAADRLRRAADQVIDAGLNQSLENAQASIDGLSAATAKLSDDLSRLNEFVRVFDRIALVVQLAEAFATANPVAIARGLSAIAGT